MNSLSYDAMVAALLALGCRAPHDHIVELTTKRFGPGLGCYAIAK
jgi:hypothetical protein